MKIFVTIGRGGSGKTSFVALMAKYLIEKEMTPFLLVDADPDQNLGESVGVDLEKEEKKTISELIVETFLEKKGTIVGIPPSERIENEILAKGLYEGDKFDFISIGPKWIEGCYCLPNNALKNALLNLTKTYAYMLIDSPAGFENLNRRITSDVDSIFDIIDPSKKSLDHVNRSYRITKEVGIKFKNFYVVGGFRFPESLKNEAEKMTGIKFLGKIEFDEDVERSTMQGKSLLEISSESPAYSSLKTIMEKINL